ncbi:MAG: methionyl-tRNA formyltransferase [Pseudomonadota bacterium]
MENMRIVFMGTPEFAVPSLKNLITRKENIVAVVTQPDRPVGRGQHITPSPVKQCALAHSIHVLQPERIKRPEFFELFKSLKPDLAIVAAYGQIFSRALLDIPACGFINVHSSLLPAYRGPAPINRSIINGDTETGITIMKVCEGLDTGDIIIQEKMPILPDDNAETLHDRLADCGAELLGKSVNLLKAGIWNPVPQNHARATYAPPLNKEDGRIDWTRDARSIVNQIRGMTPWPGCFTYLAGKLLKVHRAGASEKESGFTPGTIASASRDGIEVVTGSGTLFIRELQLEGKKKLSAEDFLKGNKLTPGVRLENKD